MATTSSVPWEPNSASSVCRLCGWKWGLLRHRRHHCRNCGKLVCGRCSRNNIKLPEYNDEAVRVCDKCFLVITAPASAGKKIPELAVTSKVQFAVQPGTVKPIKDKNDIDIVDFDEADESEEDNDDEEGASKDPGHLLQLEEMGLHNSTSHDFGGPNTAERYTPSI